MTGTTAGTTATARAAEASAHGSTQTASTSSGQKAPSQSANKSRNAAADSAARLAQAEHLAASAHTKSLSELVADKKTAQRALSAAINAQRPADELARLKASVKTIQQAEAKATAKAKAEAEAKAAAEAASSAKSTLDQVLAARAIELDINELLKTALSNDRIPVDLKAELPTAMAKVQAVSSHAPGISVEIIAGVEVGRSSRHGATVWASTVKGGGQVHGYAYEIIAASRFIDSKRIPGNGGRPVQVIKGSDDLIFGQKLPAADGRKTVEADILIVKEGGHKIAIDAKNYSRPLAAPKDFREQLDGIKESIRQGEVHEFHFAVRGRISDTAKEAIQQADLELRDEMRNAGEKTNPTVSEMQAALGVDLAQPVISWHEELG